VARCSHSINRFSELPVLITFNRAEARFQHVVYRPHVLFNFMNHSHPNDAFASSLD